MTKSRFIGKLWAMPLLALLMASYCGPQPPERATFDVVVSSSDARAAAILVSVADSRLLDVDPAGFTMTQVDSASGFEAFLISGPITPGATLFTVTVSNRDASPNLRVLQAARGASGGFANLDPASFSLYVDRTR